MRALLVCLLICLASCGGSRSFVRLTLENRSQSVTQFSVGINNGLIQLPQRGLVQPGDSISYQLATIPGNITAYALGLYVIQKTVVQDYSADADEILIVFK